MPRILFVTQTHNLWGGMEQWLDHFSRWLQQQEHWEVLAALPRGARFNEPDAYLREHNHLEPVIIDVRSGTERSRVLRLARAIRNVDPDIVLPIASGAVFDAVSLARAEGARARLIVPIRSLHPDLFCNVVEEREMVDHVVAVSHLIERALIELLPGFGRVHYVRHGARPACRSRIPRGGPLRAGFVGRLEESTKRISDLAALADKLGSEIELHVFGNGPDQGLLNNRQVIVHGASSQDELYERAYPMLDVLLLFSPAEGSPNAVYEAMQHGVVPVIARYQGQQAEGIVRDGETGITFPVGDVEAAATALRSLSRDALRLARLAANASAEMAGHTDERMHRDWVRILDAALTIAPRPAKKVELARAGRIDALPFALADAIRRVRGVSDLADGWAEWPGTKPASLECIKRVLALLARIDETPVRT